MTLDGGVGESWEQPPELEAVLAATEPAPTNRRSPASTLLWGLAAIPSAALALILSMAVRVRIQSGSWPIRNQPDPKDLGIHNTITLLAILASFVAVVAVPMLSLALYFRRRDRAVPYAPPLVAVVGLIALFALLAGDIGGLGEWIAD
jgi:amino acid transporter